MDLASERAWKTQTAAHTLNMTLGTVSAVPSPSNAAGFDASPFFIEAEMPPASASALSVKNAGAWSTTLMALLTTRSSAFRTYSSVADTIFSAASSISFRRANPPPRGRWMEARDASGANAVEAAGRSAASRESFMVIDESGFRCFSSNDDWKL